LRDEQPLPAARAAEGAGTLLEVQRAASRRLGAVLAHHLVLLRAEDLAPLGFGVGDRIGFRFHHRPHCALMFPSFTTRAHFAISASMYLPKSAVLMVT